MNQNPGPPQGQPPGGPPQGQRQRPYAQGPYGQGQPGQGQPGQGQPGQGQPGQGQPGQGQPGQGQPGQGQPGQYGPGRPGPQSPGQYGQTPYGQGPQGQQGPNSGWGTYAATQAMPASRHAGEHATPAVVTTARILLGVAAVVALGYGVFAILLLRGVYSDFDAGDASTGDVDDRLGIHNIAVWVAIVLVVVSLAAWVASIVTAKRGAKGLGIGGLALTVAAAGAAGFGLISMTGADNGADAATGAFIAGIGFAVVAVGLVLGLFAMRTPSTPDTPRGPYSGGPGNRPQDQYGQGQPSQYGQGQYGQGQPGPYGQGQSGQYGQSPPGYSQQSGPYGQQPGQPPYGGPPGR